MNEQSHSLEAIQDIRRLMTRSSRFLSLSGLSGIAAGAWALAGSVVAWWLTRPYRGRPLGSFKVYEVEALIWTLLLLAGAVFLLALGSAFYFTWRRARRQGVSLWDRSSRQLAINMLIPLVTGGFVILWLLQLRLPVLVAPICLIFYGLALINASKYTVNDIRYLGVLEIVLGLFNTQFLGYGLFFWAIGFGVLHVIHGFVMWWKNERGEAQETA